MVPGVLGDRGVQRVRVPKCTHQSRIIIIIIIIYYLFGANIYMNIFKCALQVTLK